MPDASTLKELQAMLSRLSPALMQKVKAGQTDGAKAVRIDVIGEMVTALPKDSPLTGVWVWEFPSSKYPNKAYSVTYGRAGHLQCTCPGFEYRAECKHDRDVRKTALAKTGRRRMFWKKKPTPAHSACRSAI